MKISLDMGRRQGKVRCDRGGCGSEFETSLREFLEEYHFCFICKRLLAGVPLRDEKAFRRSVQEQRELWEKLRCFNMSGTGASWLDRELLEKFGPWNRKQVPLYDAE